MKIVKFKRIQLSQGEFAKLLYDYYSKSSEFSQKVCLFPAFLLHLRNILRLCIRDGDFVV